MSPDDLFILGTGEPKGGSASCGEGDMTSQWLAASATQRDHLMIGHSFAHAKNHPLYAFRGLHAGVFKIRNFRGSAEGAEPVTRDA